MWLLCQGACLKYLRSIAGRMVFTVPPRMLPEKSTDAKMLRPAVGEIGWLTVLYVYEGTMWLVRMPWSEFGPATPLKLMYWKYAFAASVWVMTSLLSNP